MSNEGIRKSQQFEARLLRFSEDIIGLCRALPNSHIIQPISSQLIRSGTSIGANYSEACNASSKKDFRNKIFICKKESHETKYWLKLVIKACLEKKNETERLFQEAHEFNLIFQKTLVTLESNKNMSK